MHHVFAKIHAFVVRPDTLKTGISASDAVMMMGIAPAMAKEHLLNAESQVIPSIMTLFSSWCHSDKDQTWGLANRLSKCYCRFVLQRFKPRRFSFFRKYFRRN
ncbi:Vacuolar protein sorting-associated protein 36-like protein [Drosera capensis]